MNSSGGHPSAILFDVDGTLVDTYRLYLESYRRALAGYLGHAPTDAEILERTPISERRFLDEWVGAGQAGACHAEMCDHYRRLHASYGDGMYDGVREMLAALRAAGLAIGVVTGKGADAWSVTADAYDLGPFDVVVTEEDVEEPKPDPAGLIAAAQALRLQPQEFIYIGDSLVDMEAGRRAGMMVGAGLWAKTGPGEREEFMRQIKVHAPDWTFERPADVVRALAPWC